jgi:hypothetical protein
MYDSNISPNFRDGYEPITTISMDKNAHKYCYLSGAKYITTDTMFNVNRGDMFKTSYFATKEETKRGSIQLSDCMFINENESYYTTQYITGSKDDTNETIIYGGDTTFYLKAQDSGVGVIKTLTAKHVAFGIENDS